MKHIDVLVIGAGPAGLCAATEAAKAGLSVWLMDEQPRPGGQIYRAIEAATPRRLDVLGADYAKGHALVDSFRKSGARYLAGALVWNIGSDRVVDFSVDGKSAQVQAAAIVSATGALERPMPIAGWTLPGVTTVGALQILLKASGVVQSNTVLAGSGPLLWLVADQMVRAGAPPRAVVDTTPKGRTLAAARYLPRALRAHHYIRKGLAMIGAVKRAGVPIYRHATNLTISGETTAQAISFTAKGKPQRIDAEAIALHQGVVPNQQVTRLVQAKHAWDAAQMCFRPVLDDAGQTSAENIYVAGDGGGIGGAQTAALQGRLVALGILQKRGFDTAQRLARLRAALAKDQAIRPMLETLYAPAPEILAPADDVMVCRCEEVTAGRIRETVRMGAPGPNQIKSMLRAGMGPCQGRVCGLAVASIIAVAKGEAPSVTDYYRIRPPLKPIPLSELATFEIEELTSEGALK